MSRATNNYTLILDTETTGLPPRNVHPSHSDAWDKCRIVQIAWELYDDKGNHVSSECYLVRPVGFIISPEVSRIHGITHEHAVAHGFPIAHVKDRLHEVLPCVRRIVAHNMSFDDSVVQAELFRMMNGGDLLSMWNTCEKICTMKAACTHPRQKWPKLSELYQRYFGVPPEEVLHRADADVRVCAAVYHFQQGLLPH